MSEPAGSTNTPSPPFRVKREVPRFAFLASIEVTEANTGARMSGKVSEISRKGCFIQIPDGLPVGTPVTIAVSRDKETFTSGGAVIYTRKGEGVGVAFKQTDDGQLAILDAWLKESCSLCFFTPQ